jgi:glycosyltransferase involved in cell wall biosynthesis
VAPKRAPRISIILPAKDEASGLTQLLPALRERHPEAEIIVVDDGSRDDTVAICRREKVSVQSHPYSQGNGAAVKTGARAASGDVLVFMDADTQHRPEDVATLLAALEEGYDMAVGARDGAGQASLARHLGNAVYNRFASWMVDRPIADLTSGFRAVRAEKFREFLYLLPNGFSYPTSITMAFFRSGYRVKYVPVRVGRRSGRSHLRPLHDGLRFMLIMFRITTLYSPLKLFLPVSLSFFLIGLCYYLYTFTMFGRFTNMSALLFINSVLVFLIGLVSEQITLLIFKSR